MQERIAVVFDFDDTLGPDSTTGFLKHAGLKDIEGFWKEVGALMADDWDPVPAYLFLTMTVRSLAERIAVAASSYQG